MVSSALGASPAGSLRWAGLKPTQLRVPLRCAKGTCGVVVVGKERGDAGASPFWFWRLSAVRSVGFRLTQRCGVDLSALRAVSASSVRP